MRHGITKFIDPEIKHQGRSKTRLLNWIISLSAALASTVIGTDATTTCTLTGTVRAATTVHISGILMKDLTKINRRDKRKDLEWTWCIILQIKEHDEGEKDWSRRFICPSRGEIRVRDSWLMVGMMSGGVIEKFPILYHRFRFLKDDH